MGAASELMPGRLYFIRGGHIVRYLGPGQSPWISPSSYVREVTQESARPLRVRLVQALVRGLREEAAWCREVMSEVGVTEPDLRWLRARGSLKGET